jgi:hypothetical protein
MRYKLLHITPPSPKHPTHKISRLDENKTWNYVQNVNLIIQNLQRTKKTYLPFLWRTELNLTLKEIEEWKRSGLL